MELVFDNKYTVKLDTRALIGIEKELRENPVNLFLEEDRIPQLNVLLTILFYSGRRFNKWTNMNQIYDIFDAYCEEGGSIMTLTQFITELFTESGLISNGDGDENNTKGETESKN